MATLGHLRNGPTWTGGVSRGLCSILPLLPAVKACSDNSLQIRNTLSSLLLSTSFIFTFLSPPVLLGNSQPHSRGSRSHTVPGQHLTFSEGAAKSLLFWKGFHSFSTAICLPEHYRSSVLASGLSGRAHYLVCLRQTLGSVPSTAKGIFL